jgi:hypothetical protein
MQSIPVEDSAPLQRTRFARTFAWREVFFPTYTPPEKIAYILFRRLAAKLCEALYQIISAPNRGASSRTSPCSIQFFVNEV